MIRNIVFILLFCSSALGAFAQETKTSQKSDANMTGHVINKKSYEHLPFVNIGIQGTVIGTTTDKSGHYTLNNLPEGEFVVVVSSVGYKTIQQTVTLKRSKTIEVNFELEEDAILLDNVVVSANKNETNRKEAVTIVNVITPKNFEINNSVCIADGLNFQAGLRVENNCQNCGFNQLRINGLGGAYSQILIDSRAISSALAGVYGLEHIPVNMIDRVEVVRGGGSAIFGSNAVAGTLNIITREPSVNSLTISNTTQLIMGKSPENSLNLNATLLTNNQKAGITLFGAVRNRKAFDYDGDGFTEIPKINGKNIGFRGFYRLGNRSKLTAEYHYIDEFRRGGNLLNLPPHEADIAEQISHSINSASLKYDLFMKSGIHILQFYSSFQHIDRSTYYGAGKDPNAYGNTTDLVSLSGAQYTFKMKKFLFLPATLIAGAEFSYNALHDQMVGYDREIKQNVGIYSLFLQNEWSNKTVTLLLGGRLDKHTLIKSLIASPRISVRWAPVHWLNLRGSYSTGYRGPQAFDEDLHITAVGGNVSIIKLADNLKPEHSQSAMLSVEFSHSWSKFAFLFLAEGFYTDLNRVFVIEEIGKDAHNNLILERRNGSGAIVAGINIEANLIPRKNLQFNLGFTWQISRYKELEQWSPSIAPHKEMFRAPATYGYITAIYTPIKRLDLSLSGIYTGSMLIQHIAGYIAEDEEIRTRSFFDLNLKIAYTFKLKDNIDLQLNIGMKNIINSYQKQFDQGEYRDAGFMYGPSLPRTFFGGISFSL